MTRLILCVMFMAGCAVEPTEATKEAPSLSCGEAVEFTSLLADSLSNPDAAERVRTECTFGEKMQYCCTNLTDVRFQCCVICVNGGCQMSCGSYGPAALGAAAVNAQ